MRKSKSILAAISILMLLSALSMASENSTIEKGLLKKTAVIKDGEARSISDVLGFVYITEINGTCYRFYAAEPPLDGMTRPVVIPCPVGIQVITNYNVSAEQAIDAVMSMDCGDAVVEMELSWPMALDTEPTWQILTNIGCHISIPAISGKGQVFSRPA